MARKRVYSELEEVDTLEEVKTASNMTVHEALTTGCSRRQSQKGKRSMFAFDGTLADTTHDLIGFNSASACPVSAAQFRTLRSL